MPSPDSAATDALQRSADLLAQQRPEEARALLTDLTAEAPLHATAQMLLAKACEATGDLRAALTAWHQAFFLVPTSPVVQRERQRLTAALATGTTSALPQPTVPPLPRRTVSLPPVETDVLPFDPDGPGDFPGPASVLEDSPPAPEMPTAPPPSLADETYAGEMLPTEPLTAEEGPFAEEEPFAGTVAPEAREGRLPEEPADIEDVQGVPEEDEPPTDAASTAPDATPEEHAQADRPAPVEEPYPPLDFDNLDTLIEQLEQAPRIIPDPDFEDPDAPPPADDTIADDMVSETLARIFVAQDRIDEAIQVYDTLAEREPARRDEWRAKADDLRRQHDHPGGDPGRDA